MWIGLSEKKKVYVYLYTKVIVYIYRCFFVRLHVFLLSNYS